MKKRAISFVLCLMMVVTLLGNGVPVYAADDPVQPVITTEETSSENTAGDASLATPSEAEPSDEPEEEPEATPPVNDTEETPEEPAAEAADGTPDAATPAEAEEAPQPANEDVVSEAREAVYTIHYEFKNNPTWSSLKQDIMVLLPPEQTDVADGTVVTPPDLEKTHVADSHGVWDFVGWDKNEATVDGEDITFIGTWKLTPYKNLYHSFTFEVDYRSIEYGYTELPQEILDMVPDAVEGLKEGDPMPYPTPEKTKVKVDGGEWVFSGWASDEPTIKENTTTMGTWLYYVDSAPESYTVNYEFKSDPHYEPLPEIAKNLRPAPQTDVEYGTIVTPRDLAVTEVKGSSGIWHFQGWNKTTATILGSNVTFTGTWKLTPYKGLHSAYQFSPSTPSKQKGYDKLPQEVIDLLPDALEGLTKGQTITHPTPAKTEVEVDGGKWVFDGWPLGNTKVITANTTTYGTWSFIEKTNTYTVNYEFKNLPAYRPLPQRVKDLLPAPQADVANGTVVTPPQFAVTQVKDLSGIWHFQGWDKTTATVDGADVTFTGTWKLTQYKTFFSSYNFVPSKASMDKGHTTLPQEVIDLIPDAMEGLTDGQVITHPTPAKTEVAAEGGKWVFAGWPVGNTATVQNGNIVTVAEWNFVEGPDKPTMKFTVTFKFVSLTNGTDGKPKELPQDVLDLLPAPITNLEAGTHVNCPTLAKTEIPAEGGKWVFTGWPAGTGINGITITGSALVVGGWRFDKESTPGTTPGTDPTEDKIGNLTVTKTVSGSGGDQNRDFTFTVTLDKKDLNGKYGDMTFTGGVATFTLKHGQSKTANGLPTGVSYTVEESDNSGYTVTKTNAAGTIQTGSTATASFENYKGSSGGGGGGGSSTTKYTLTYESNGGTEYKSERHTAGTVVKLDKSPTREGYVFTGWYADRKLTDEISSIRMNGNKTVYAGWEKNSPAQELHIPSLLNGEEHFAYIAGYTDGTVRPLNDITRAEVAMIFYRLLKDDVREANQTTVNTFMDVTENMWCNTAISTIARLGIVKGRSSTEFDPNAPITRAEFATICARFDQSNIESGVTFSDISDCWAKAYIERAAALGWAKGYSDGTFRPNNHITRAEAMCIINRVLGRLPETAKDLLPGMKTWPDNPESAWYYLHVQEATNSHTFERKDDGVHETWKMLQETIVSNR